MGLESVCVRIPTGKLAKFGYPEAVRFILGWEAGKTRVQRNVCESRSSFSDTKRAVLSLAQWPAGEVRAACFGFNSFLLSVSVTRPRSIM